LGVYAKDAQKGSPSPSQNTVYASGASQPSPLSDVDMSDQDQSHRSVSADTLSLPGLECSDDESIAQKRGEDSVGFIWDHVATLLKLFV